MNPKNHYAPSLLNQIIFFFLVLLTALFLQMGLSRYQTRNVVLPQQQRTEQIRVISQYLNTVEDCMRTLDNHRWDYGDVQALQDQVAVYLEEADRLLPQMAIPLESGREEEYLLSNASTTTYDTFSQLVREVLALLSQEERDQAAELYYAKAAPCGGYLRQYTQQLLETTIQASQSAYAQLGLLSHRLSRAQTIVFGFCGLACFATMVSLMLLLTSIRQMASASQSISQGNLDIPDVDETRGDEIGHMARTFNEMKRSMKRQVAVLEERNEMERALYKKQKEALELQTLMEQEKRQKLRSQVNPHFLFNTLNVILYTAQQEGAVKTQSLIGSLGNLFRYTLASNAALVPLAREVRIVNEFYTLNKARFGHRINLRWQVSPEVDLTEVLTPSFLIQPLVENAFRHGLARKEEGGTAVVSIDARDAVLLVTVADDGVGMSEETLDALRKNLESPPDTGDHIGLYNVAARVRLRGEGYGLEIHSRLGEGTQVRLRLPLVTEESEEEADVEYSDRG